jgi:hypothetical protein
MSQSQRTTRAAQQARQVRGVYGYSVAIVRAHRRGAAEAEPQSQPERRRRSEQPRAHHRAASSRCDGSVGATHIVFRLNVRAALQQQSHHGRVAPDCGTVQRRPVILHAPHAAHDDTADRECVSAQRRNGGNAKRRMRGAAAAERGCAATGGAHNRAPVERRRAHSTVPRAMLPRRLGRVTRRTLLFASMSAPRSSSKVTTDAWPQFAARCSGVLSFCAPPTQHTTPQRTATASARHDATAATQSGARAAQQLQSGARRHRRSIQPCPC